MNMNALPADIADSFSSCRLCPRRCGVDRLAGHTGVCGQTARLRIASIGKHFGEEPPLTGTGGSGTVFFSGCSCRCFFCQNHQITLQGIGDLQNYDEFLVRVIALAKSGVHNINVVTADHYWPYLVPLKAALRASGIDIPLVFNTSGYLLPETVEALAGCVDIFLPDYKYDDPELARQVMGDANYPALALAAIRLMVDAKGFLDSFILREPVATRGVLVRHLVLPGAVENSISSLERLYDAFGPGLPLSVMSQYMPVPGCAGKPPFDRRITAHEHEAVLEAIERLGFTRVFTQELHGDDDYLPDFDRDDPFAGSPA